MTIVDGNLVNGIPTTLGDGINGTSGKFGEVCYDTTTSSDCYNVATGVETYTHNGTTDTYQYDPAGGDAGTTPLPDATLDNGLPGATNFVPNDRDPDAATHTRGAYFDVTLGAAGTTTLDTNVTVDRLTVAGSGAKLNVTSAGSLKSLIDITQLDGLVNNDGKITSVGDYLMLSGGVSGTGRFNVPYFTSLNGIIAPGTIGTIGTLTFGGSDGLLIGEMRGSWAYLGRAAITRFSRATGGLRPRDLLLSVVRALAVSYGIERVRGVGQAAHPLDRRAGVTASSYDRFWRRHGGVLGADGFYDLPRKAVSGDGSAREAFRRDACEAVLRAFARSG